jgi:hypothetical protein
MAAERNKGINAMERDVLARIKPLVDGNRIEPAMFFRLCALMGISFAAAMALAADSPAFAKTVASISPAPSGYADIVGPDVVAYLDAVAATDSPSPTAEFDDHFFVQKSGEPFPKFDKAP